MEHNSPPLERLIMEIELQINHSLWNDGAISEELYRRAQELIIKKQGRGNDGSICDPQ